MLIDWSDLTPPPFPMPAQSEGDFIDADEDNEDPYDAFKQDVLNAYLFVAHDLEQMPVTTLDVLLYYCYGFSLNKSAYTDIPSLVEVEVWSFCSWAEVCHAVRGQQLGSLAVNEVAIMDFLSILAGSSDPSKMSLANTGISALPDET